MYGNYKTKRASEAWKLVMSNFTDDLWTEIFLRLPFESLLRFKSVSKTWFSIISSHRFAISHLAIAPKDDQILIVHHEKGYPEDGEDGHFSFYHLDSRRILENLNFPYSQGEYPFKPEDSELIGSECGIACVSVCVSDWKAAKNNYDLYLWNPATKQSKLIPPYALHGYHMSDAALGFGFDHIDLDFKVVRVISCTRSAEVYSSNMNNWHKIKQKISDGPIKFHICFHGFLCALQHYSGSKGMVAFDLNKEVFICRINVPVSSFEFGSSSEIAQYKDSIAFIHSDSIMDGKINLWTLDNEACLSGGGVEASWTKVLILDVGVPFLFVEGLFNNTQFLLFGVGGDRLLYNSNNKSSTEVPGYPNIATCEFFKYTKSLFSLTGFKRIKWAAPS
ncbi:F-box/kelch-repeat protein At3g06240 [Daucus carota subsp. sativus]|uniref:F-box domain-containing protein n=1 Tax=Daucus carota subsp. sativus TaxID=79200 RepID=A0A175YPI5_DAUCS|nr:PREDICTED: F-box/kelch-repeat protein At3g06240-like [Daucus carota subsp. sativus]